MFKFIFLFSIAFQLLANVKVVTLEHPPFISSKLPEKGWAWSIAQNSFKAVGVRSSLIIVPWARALHLAENGDVDALYIANKTPERQAWAYFSDPVGKEVTVLFKLKNKKIKKVNMKGIKIAALRGGVPTKLCRNRFPLATYHEVTELEQGLKMLLLGRVDLFLGDKFVVKYLSSILDMRGKELEVHVNDIADTDFYMAFSKRKRGAKKLRDDFNEGLRIIKKSGLYDKILKN